MSTNLEEMNGRAVPVPSSPMTSQRLERVQKLRIGSPVSKAASARSGVSWLPWVLCAVLALTWGGVAIRSYRAAPAASPAATGGDTSNNSAASSSSREKSTNTSSARPDSPPAAAGANVVEAKGYIVAAQQISVSPIDVGGKLIELNFVEGRVYQKGTVLARIDPTSFLAQLDEAEKAKDAAEQRCEASLRRWKEQDPKSLREIERTQAQAELDEAKALELRAQQELERQNAAKDTAALSARELQQAQSDYNAAKARRIRLVATLEILEKGPRPERVEAARLDYASAQADVKVAEARVAQSRWRLDNCEIRAPITGTVLFKKAEIYNLVNPMAFSGGGAICDMADLSRLEIEVEIAEREIARLTTGQPCRFRPDAYPDRVYDARLDRIMPIANRDKSIVLVRVSIDLKNEEPGKYLKPGMGGVVSFLAP